MSVTNNHSTKKVAVVTGGANGIGAAISKTLVVQDYQVMIADRDADTGKAFADSINATFFQVDLSEKSACKELIEATVDQLGSVDILVNNAGFQHISPLVEFPEDVWNNMMNVMLNAPFLLTKYAWPHMQKNQWGRIVNIGSIASFMPTPNFAAYGASKAFVLSFSEGIAEELRGTGVTVTCVCPGMTETKMLSHADGFEKFIPKFLKADPMELASQAYKASMKGDVVFLDKIANKLLVQWATHYPRWMVRGVNGLFARFK